MQNVQLPQPPQNIPPLQKGPHIENIKAITTLRSGKTLEDPYKIQEPIEKSCNQNEEAEEIENTISNKVLENKKEKEKIKDNPALYQPRIPFPTALEVGKERKK